MAFETIRKDSAPEAVVRAILAEIRAGSLPPGATLPSQKELAKQLGVGRSSIREAVNVLSLMGYLDIQQGRGTFVCDVLPVTELSASQMQVARAAKNVFDLMEARLLLECQCARWAAERASSRQVTGLEAAARLIAEQTDDYDRFLEADLQFHLQLAKAAQNNVVIELMKPIIGHVRTHHQRYRGAVLMPVVQQRAAASAMRLVEAIAQGRVAAAAQEMQRHLETVVSELKEIVKSPVKA